MDMIRRGFSPAGKTAFAAALALLCAAAAFGQPTIQELLGQMPAQTTQDLVAASQSLIAPGRKPFKASARRLCRPAAAMTLTRGFC